MKHIAHHAVALLEVKLIVVGDDTCSVLAAVLQNDQTVVEVLNDVMVARYCDYSAHRKQE